MLSTINKPHKEKWFMISLICGTLEKKRSNIQKQRDIECKDGNQRWRREGN
jgi:hypothetical protein